MRKMDRTLTEIIESYFEYVSMCPEEQISEDMNCLYEKEVDEKEKEYKREHILELKLERKHNYDKKDSEIRD